MAMTVRLQPQSAVADVPGRDENTVATCAWQIEETFQLHDEQGEHASDGGKVDTHRDRPLEPGTRAWIFEQIARKHRTHLRENLRRRGNIGIKVRNYRQRTSCY
jgi:hypothetical protein